VLTALKREVLAQGKPLRRRITLSGSDGGGLCDLFVQPVRRDGQQVTGLSGVLTRLDDPSERR
jgi:hypothetical protein